MKDKLSSKIIRELPVFLHFLYKKTKSPRKWAIKWKLKFEVYKYYLETIQLEN